MYSIYEIHNSFHHKYYVGMTSDFEKRIKEHQDNLKYDCHPCSGLQCDYNYLKNLRKKFTYTKVAEHPDKEIAGDVENYFIYKHLARKGEGVYNDRKTFFFYDTWLLEADEDYINSIIDNRTLLYAYFKGNIPDKNMSKICERLGREYLLEIMNS